MSFPDAARADKNNVGALTNEVEGGSAFNDLAVDGFGAREVVDVEAGNGKYPSTFDGGAGTLFEVYRS